MKKRLLFWFALFLLAAVGLSAEEKPKVIRVGNVGGGYGKARTTGVGAILAAKGWLDAEFKAQGISVQQHYFAGAGPAINEALANGSLDFACYGDLPAIIGKAAGLKTVALAGARGSHIYVAVPANSPARSIADLKGKQIGVAKGTYMHLAFGRKLDSLGLSESDFRIVNINSANGQNALAAKSIDAYVGNLNLLRLRDLRLARVIYDNRNDPEDWHGHNVLVVQESFLRKYPETTKRFLKAWLRAQQWISNDANRNEAMRLSANDTTPLNYLIEDRNNVPLRRIYNPLFDSTAIAHYRKAVQFSKQHGLIRQEFDIDKWIDRNLLQQALKEIGWSPS